MARDGFVNRREGDERVINGDPESRYPLRCRQTARELWSPDRRQNTLAKPTLGLQT